MLADGIVYFLALAASFFLFYFNVPYWTGKDMADMSDSGIWRAFFRFLSFLGYGVYWLFDKLFEVVAQPVCNLLVGRKDPGKISERHVLYRILDVLRIFLFAGFLWLLTNMYTGFMDYLFGSAPIADLAESGGEGFLGFLSRGICFLRVLVDFKRPTQEWTFGLVAAATITTLIGLVIYVVINTLFFSILYGLLRQLLDEVHPLNKLPFLQKKEAPALPAASDEDESSARSKLSELWEQIMDSVRDFLGKMTIYYEWRHPVSLILTLVVLFLFSFAMTYFGKNDLTPLDVVKEVLDSIGVVQIVLSFIVTWLMGKLAEKSTRAVVRHLPQGMQNAIHRLSAKGNAWADAQDAKRQGKAAPKPSSGSSMPDKLEHDLAWYNINLPISAWGRDHPAGRLDAVGELKRGSTPLCREFQALGDDREAQVRFLKERQFDIIAYLKTLI